METMTGFGTTLSRSKMRGDGIMKELEGQVALVTGGTAGVGLRTAEMLAASGARVIVTGRSQAGGDAALERLRAINPEAHFESGDLNNYDSVQRIIENAAAHYGGIDILVSAGAEGAVGPKPFAQMTAKEIQDAFSTRIFPRIYPVHAVVPILQTGGGGSVVMLTTDAARHVTPGESIVGAAGASVILMTKALARELSRDNIRVNAVAMTITSDTSSWDRIFSRQDFTSKLFDKAVSRFPSGKPPTATEVAEVVAFLASNRAAQVTGQTVSVNGGLSFGGW
jgi:2-hydroxycyclohexanecarboxyl-CoA dehydrogenase